MSVIRNLAFMAIVFSFSVIGFSGAHILRLRVRILRELISSLELLKGEICSRLCPLPELMEKLGKEQKPPVSLFYSNVAKGMEESLGEKSFSAIWEEAVIETADLGLSGEEQETLILLGKSLGRFEAGEQEQAITSCIGRLYGFLDTAQENSRSRGKLWACLGASAGLLLAIVLI